MNILILSDSPFLTTGYSTIAKRIANTLSLQGHSVHFLAYSYIGQNLKPGCEFEDGYKLNFNIIGGGREAYFKDLLPIYTKQYKADVLLILLDTFMLYPWIMELDLSPAKTIFYFPSDGGGGMPLGCENILRFINYPVAMAKFGQQQVKQLYNIDTLYIPHAVDTKQFYPMTQEQKAELRRKTGLQGKFIIGTVARNQGRKMMDRTIKIMSEYSKLNPNAIMLLHTDPMDAAQVFPIQNLVERYRLQNRVFFTGMKYYKGFDYAQMNEVYNLFDVFLLTTSGEGFGIPIIEAEACGIPVLVTDYTTSRELIEDGKAGLLIDLAGVSYEDNPRMHNYEILDGTITGSWMVERGLCSIKDGVKKLKMLEDEKLREELGRNGRLWVLENYDWSKIDRQWTELITKIGNKL